MKASAAPVVLACLSTLAAASQPSLQELYSLRDWVTSAYSQLPCEEYAESQRDGSVVVNGQHRITSGTRDGATLAHSWDDIHGIVSRYMDAIKPQLLTAERWTLDGEAGARLASALFNHSTGSGPVNVPYVSRVQVPPGSRVVLFGDLHGSIHSFLRTLGSLVARGLLTPQLRTAPGVFLAFLGDYVDRGPHGLETLALILRLRALNPHTVFATRGNHEDLAMNVESVGGTFLQELRQKMGSRTARATAGDGDKQQQQQRDRRHMEELFHVYDTLPLAIFLGTAQAGADGGGAYVQLCHGGIEPGYDPLPFLSSSPPPPPSTSSDDVSVGATVSFSYVHGLWRRAWLDSLPSHLRDRISGGLQKMWKNHGQWAQHAAADTADVVTAATVDADGNSHGSGGGTGMTAAVSALAAVAATQTVDEDTWPVSLTGLQPHIGWCWYDFNLSPEAGPSDPAMSWTPGRGVSFGRSLTRYWLAHTSSASTAATAAAAGNSTAAGTPARVVGILRAHQHNNARITGRMLDHVREGGGMHDNWKGLGTGPRWFSEHEDDHLHQHQHGHTHSPQYGPARDSSMVVTLLSGAHVPGMSFYDDAYGLLQLGDAAGTATATGMEEEAWRLSACKHRSGQQYVQLGGRWLGTDEAAGGTPPDWLLSHLQLPHACHWSDEFTCTDSGWRVHTLGGAHDAEPRVVGA